MIHRLGPRPNLHNADVGGSERVPPYGSSQCSSHAVILKDLPACVTELLAVLLEALLDGVVAVSQLLSAKPRCVARTSVALLRRARLGLRVAIAQNQHGKCQHNPAHSLLPGRSAISVSRLTRALELSSWQHLDTSQANAEIG
jgi:hypothetical protein